MQQENVTIKGQHKDSSTPLICPRCDSTRIESLNYAKKTGGAIGTVAGGAAGYIGAMSGAEIGATAGMVAGPLGVAVGGLIGALFGAVVGGSAGCAAGAKLGEVVDNTIMSNYHCLDCDHTFGKSDN
jgi:hypothetical protein